MQNKWFTLVELLVWISISMILMISVWALVSGWINNITRQEKTLQNSWDFSDFERKLNNIFSNIDTSFEPKITSSWVIIKINQNYDQGGFAYIWITWSTITDWNWIYCNSWSEDINTNHIFIKTFIPKFDISTQKSHKINWIWKWIFWYNEIPKEWIDPNKVYLNNPTWTASWTINWNNIKFISDTLNNRILYKSWSLVYELLNENDWINEPTWLYYDNSEKALYIANSWKWEILKYSSKKHLNAPNLILSWITDWIYDLEIISNTWTTVYSSWSINLQETNTISETFQSWNYYAKISTWSTILYYPYFTQGDDNILTKEDNSLEIYSWWLNYPTEIDSSLNITEYFTWSLSNMDYDDNYDYILKTPIKELKIDWDNSKKLLNLSLIYYKKYNCYNLDEKIERTLILKKNFR